MKRLGLSVILALTLVGLGALPAAADPLQHDVAVDANDAGFNPPSVTIPVGGSVTWIEKGINIHTATSLGGAPQQFSTGGFGSFQSVSLTFNTAGTYGYTSATDCLNGNNMPRFTCGIYYVIVVPPGANPSKLPPPAIPAANPPPPGQATPAPAAIPANAVAISDAGVSPAAVTIAAGGAVTWTNSGNQVHTATSTGTVPMGFDSGGMGPGQSSQVTFPLPGTYTYTSAVDCLGGSHVPAFNCGPYTVVVTAPASK
jgi:plastocyanin